MTHRPAPDDEAAVLAARAAQLARPAAGDMRDDGVVDVIPFRVRGQRYAAPAAGVREVRRLGGLARLPRAPAGLLGVSRVRSTIVPVFDLPVLLGLAAGDGDGGGPAWILVLDAEGHAPLGLAAEWVDGVEPQPVADVAPLEAADALPSTVGVTRDGAIVLNVEGLLAADPVFAPTARSAAASAPPDVSNVSARSTP